MYSIKYYIHFKFLEQLKNIDEWQCNITCEKFLLEYDDSSSNLTVVEWKDYHFLAVATISDLQNSYCNQWPHPYEPQISSRFVFSAVCLHFRANKVKFSEKTSAIKTKSPQK